MAGGIPAPPPPVFLTGALAPFFTNAEGFSAHIVLERPPSPTRPDIAAGELMGRDGNLFFAPEPGPALSKRTRREDFSFIWNVNEHQGFLLNGPLQGYAPISSNVRFTNVVVSPSAAAPEKVAGYTCQVSEVKATATDGSETALKVWQARDLKGLPVRATGTVGGTPVTLSLSSIRLQQPPPDLFQPPSDFTRYRSPETMMNELVARQENLKRKHGWQPPPTDDIGARDVNGVQMP